MNGPERQELGDFTVRAAIAVGLGVLGVSLLLLLWAAASLLALVFAGVLIGVLLRATSRWVSRHTGLSDGWALAAVIASIVVAVAGVTWAAAPQIAEQTSALAEQIPRSLRSLQETLSRNSLGRWLLDYTPDLETMEPRSGLVIDRITGVLSGAIGAVVSVVVALFIGVYLAVDPRLYVRGMLALAPRPARPRLRRLVREMHATLRAWLVGKMVVMAAVGTLTGMGLWIVGMDMVVVLALLTALMEFVPNFGPYIAAAPAVLVALPHGWQMVAWVVLVFVVVQTIEGYVLTPLVEKEAVSLPPALTIAVQLLLGVLLGAIGVVIAAPATAVGMVVVRELWVKEAMEGPQRGRARARPAGNHGGPEAEFTRDSDGVNAGGTRWDGGRADPAARIGRSAPGGSAMKTVQDGQCGLCVHFGEPHQPTQELVQIRVSHKAPEDLVDECGHPRHASLHLRVTPISGCDGFEPAPIPGRTAGGP